MVSVQHLLDQCRQRTTIVFGNLGRWPDRVTYYEPDYPYTILFEPNFGVHIPRSFGKTVIVFTSHLDLTWDQGVELRFFQVGRSPSHRVWEAYQPHMTDAYSVDLTDCPRVADVYVKWLTWLDDWEMHRDDPVPWRIVGLQPWKRALEQHVQRSHEKALAHGMPSDGWQRSRGDVHHRESCRATLNPKDVRFNCQENARLRLIHHPLPKSVPVEYLPFCVRGKFSQLARGNRGLMVVKGLKQQKMFQELGLYAMALENLPNFKDICDGTFPDPMHEGVHEEEDISYCTMVKSYQFAKYLQQFNKLHAEWSYKVSALTQ
ncbi:uncharacterized protein TNCV_1230421 [Trichonephila clavipes]|nr:uncharacterized protein TNCV_1230421 [Trichonephila clavipes]